MSPKTLEALEHAIADLKRDPNRVVTLRVDELDVELRVRAAGSMAVSAADRFREIGPWEGETTQEILEVLAEARRLGATRAVPPRLPVTTAASLLGGLAADRGER
jgi:hypothetical protein